LITFIRTADKQQLPGTQIMTKRIITIDIETLPADEPFESKLFWETQEEFRKTACDANLGRILCIGYSEQNEFGAITEHGCFGWRAE